MSSISPKRQWLSQQLTADPSGTAKTVRSSFMHQECRPFHFLQRPLMKKRFASYSRKHLVEKLQRYVRSCVGYLCSLVSTMISLVYSRPRILDISIVQSRLVKRDNSDGVPKTCVASPELAKDGSDVLAFVGARGGPRHVAAGEGMALATKR